MNMRRYCVIFCRSRVVRFCLLLAVVSLALSGCHDKSSPTAGDVVACQFSYGEGAAQNLGLTYVYGNTAGLRPVFFFIHGGGWKEGDKSTFSAVNCEFVLRAGLLPVSVNYTLAPESIVTDRQNPVYPQNMQDIALALRWVMDHAKEYGGDPEQIYVVGHSAGAHLAALLVCDTRFMQQCGIDPKVVKGVILLDGGGYLTLDERRFTQIQESGAEADYYRLLHDLYQNAFGAAGSSTYWAANPAQYITSGSPTVPFLLIHGGSLYRSVPNRRFEELLIEKGIPCDRYEIVDMGHGVFLSSIGTADTRVGDYILAFLEKYRSE